MQHLLSWEENFRSAHFQKMIDYGAETYKEFVEMIC